MSSLDLAKRFSELSEFERNTFNSALTFDETVAFSEKLLEGDNQRVNEIRERCDEQKEMVHEALTIAKQAIEDRSEELKDWSLFRYIKDYDCGGEFEAAMITMAVDWCKEQYMFIDDEEREEFMAIVRGHIERSRNEIEEIEGKGAAEEFMEKVSTILT